METILKENGYQNSFIKRYSKNEILAPTLSACKKRRHSFYSNQTSTIMLQTLYSPTIVRGCSKNPTWIEKPHVTSNCIYLFSCICSSTYIGRTERILSTRISEHLPKNLILNRSKLPTSAIGRHILDSGHVVDRNQSFKVIA